MMWVCGLIVAAPVAMLALWLSLEARSGMIPWELVTLIGGSYFAGSGFMLAACMMWQWVVHLRSSVLGTARFAGMQEARQAGLLGDKGVILAKKGGHVLRFGEAGHLVTISRTRGGKGVSTVIPNLLDHKGGLFCIDIKGENYAISHRYRRGVGLVHKLSPFEAASSCYNPLDFIRNDSNEIDDCELVSTLMITPSGGDDAFWEREARTLISSLIQFVVRHRDKEQRTLAKVRKLLTLPQGAFDDLLSEMSVSKHEWIRRNATAFSQKAEKERSGVISTAQSHTRFLDSPNIQRVTNTSDFSWNGLKLIDMSVYLVVPPHLVATYRPYMRLIVGLAQAAMSRYEWQDTNDVLFLLDEFPSLGKMPIAGFAYLAGYGVKLWVFSQSLSQLEAVYGKATGLILSNCAVQQMWSVAPSDVTTAEHISRTLGDKTVRNFSSSKTVETPLSATGRSYSVNVARQTRRLLTPDEILCLPKNMMILMIAGSRPYLANRLVYYKDKLFAGRFDEWHG